ncbi:LacI family DNA-binding transcriptional regulator [Paraclostridium bifermentans]|uniref:LacI family DNA-binding transcriptional regulator n=1 Tax=Paraclostridium bifermentans TaxID=1490 RepID=UPI00115A5BCA|nr:LacI family DNA-binding transcriptional regulator [Paraclostridium bifermentans]MCE9674746.1 LacI family transcriptional regulator [Paraclostridium bifermentans]MCR1874809.1 LacI family transcriptional regulator [Paraclostridium bifermentans]TQO57813.1 LacI family transcriptional regulator [Paraclostridium bifermentans]GKZ03794.1 LacI family transcriptional regulator [Paraclostridium bifermentans]GKZ05290.1 LacI family transcriptional regulator [Paraclostridium bifermentans]
MSKVTIKEVAKEAGVATSTVSRVLSNNPKISEETKAKVNEAIERLNYKPNAIARSLANNKTKILGVVLPSEADDLLTNPFFINAMKGMSIYAQNKNYYITYVFAKDGKNEFESIKEITNTNLIEGIILLRVNENDESIKFLNTIGFPFVAIGRPEKTEDVLWVDNDNFQAMYNVVNRLIQKGHKKIGFIGAIKTLNMSKDRLKGYKMALEVNGLNYDEELVIHKQFFKENTGYAGAEELLSKHEVTAIVTTDDLLAFGVSQLLNEKRLEKISLVGFNNIQLSKYQTPPLASVDINADELGYYAAKLLIEKLENEDILNTHYIVNTEFIERESFK